MAGETSCTEQWHVQIFFARVPKMASEDDIRVPFAAIGTVKEVVLFKSHQSSSLNKVLFLPSPWRLNVFPVIESNSNVCNKSRHGLSHHGAIKCVESFQSC